MLISCILYREGRKVADIPTDQIHEHIGQPNCFVWVALLEAIKWKNRKVVADHARNVVVKFEQSLKKHAQSRQALRIPTPAK
jgi:hypothetical protein